MKEEWRSITGFEETYMVSNKGRIKRIAKHPRYIRNRVLKPGNSTGGYLVIGLSRGNKKTIKHISRIVATHFIPNPNNKPEVNHIDGNNKNNNANNLEWVTRKENTEHSMFVLKTRKTKSVLCLTNGVVYKSQSHAAKDLGFKDKTFASYFRGERKSVYGHQFKVVK